MMVMFSSDAEPATGWNAGHTLRHPAAATVQVEPVAVSLVKKYSVMCDDGFTHAVLPETASESGRFPAGAGRKSTAFGSGFGEHRVGEPIVAHDAVLLDE